MSNSPPIFTHCLLSKHCTSINADRSNFLRCQHELKALDELGDANISVLFDATAYRCECFGVEIRFIYRDGEVTTL